MPPMRSFIFDNLLELPGNVIHNIFINVPPEHLNGLFIKVPPLREIILDHFHSTMFIAVHSSKGKCYGWSRNLFSPYACPFPSRNVLEVSGSERVVTLIRNTPPLVPQTAYFVLGTTYQLRETSTDVVTREQMVYLSRIPNLHIVLYNCQFIDASLKALFCISNVKSIRLRSCSINEADFSLFTSLTKVKFFSTNHVRFSERATLSPRVKTVEASGDNLTLITTSTSIEKLHYRGYSKSIEGNFFKHFRLLTTLELEGCYIATLSLSELPRNLKRLRLHDCSWPRNSEGAKNLKWPSRLEELDMSRNRIRDDFYPYLGSSLPQGLRLLNLSNNNLTNLHVLGCLPDTLEVLEVLENPIENYEDFVMVEGASEFTFPQKLTTLSIALYFPELDNDTANIPTRIEFPKDLVDLRIDSRCEALIHFDFPKSLRSLSLRQAKPSLKLVDLPEGTGVFFLDVQRLFSDQSMDNLWTLELRGIDIRDLKGWIPPPTLANLDLSCNNIEKISSDWPLFDKYKAGQLQCLTSLDLSFNIISEIDDDVCLPPNLTFLNLKDNYLKSFKFTDGFLESDSLNSLRLSSNGIRDVKACTSIQARLYDFDLSQQRYEWRLSSRGRLPKDVMSSRELYKELKKIGLEPITKKGRFQSLHQLRPIR